MGAPDEAAENILRTFTELSQASLSSTPSIPNTDYAYDNRVSAQASLALGNNNCVIPSNTSLASSDMQVLAHILKGNESSSAIELRLFDSCFSEEGCYGYNRPRYNVLVTSSLNGVKPSLAQFITNFIMVLQSSRFCSASIANTSFADNISKELKMIFKGIFNLRHGSGAEGFSIVSFLRKGEQLDVPSVLDAGKRFTFIVQYMLGPEAYRSWWASYCVEIPMQLRFDLVHPLSLLDFFNREAASFFSPEATADLQSALSRGGGHVQWATQFSFSKYHADSITQDSIQRTTISLLANASVPFCGSSVQALPSNIASSFSTPSASGSLSTKYSKGKNKAIKSGSLRSLKGYCGEWLKTAVFPCLKCAKMKHSYKHRDAWDKETPDQRRDIHAAATTLLGSLQVVP